MVRSLCDSEIREMTHDFHPSEKRKKERRKINTMVDPSVERRKKDRRKFK
jgi:hypothetical protein